MYLAFTTTNPPLLYMVLLYLAITIVVPLSLVAAYSVRLNFLI